MIRELYQIDELITEETSCDLICLLFVPLFVVPLDVVVFELISGTY